MLNLLDLHFIYCVLILYNKLDLLSLLFSLVSVIFVVSCKLT